MFTVAQTMQLFEILWLESHAILQEMATLAIIREIADSNLKTGRYSLKSGVSQIMRES